MTEPSQAVADSCDFDKFLRALDAHCQSKLETLPKQDEQFCKDPLLIAQASVQERSRDRQAKAQCRFAAMEKNDQRYENDWREQVRQRKEAERRRAVEEAAAVAAAAVAAERAAREAERLAAESTPLAIARRQWVEHDYARAAARDQAEQEHAEGVRAWLDEDWLPQLDKHKEELRMKREAEAQQIVDAKRMLEWERESMAREDDASATFIALATVECENRTAQFQASEDPLLQAVFQSVSSRHQASMRQKREHEARERQAKEAAECMESERKEQEYRAWKLEVRSARCARKRFEDSEEARRLEDASQALRLGDSSEARFVHEVLERSALEYAGDEPGVQHILNESAVEKAYSMDHLNRCILEDALQRATADSCRLKDSGLSPRSVLEQTKNQAVAERKKRAQHDPVKEEQELWESMLTKNRRARQLELSSRSPRWGVFT